MSKFKVGDRVRILSTANFDHHQSKGRSGDVQTVKSIFSNGLGVCTQEGAKWEDDEVELVTQGAKEVSNQRRTFKQLVESPTVRKGALWQEARDDGTQEYVLLDHTYNKDGVEGTRLPAIYNRELIETNHKMFVEVFQVQPQYMTQAEVDQWEAFKAAQKPVKKYGYTWTPAQREAARKRAKAQWAAKKKAA